MHRKTASSVTQDTAFVLHAATALAVAIAIALWMIVAYVSGALW